MGKNNDNFKKHRSNRLAKICFWVLLTIFLVSASIVAFKLVPKPIPDEYAHNLLISEFEKTFGIPNETEATIKRGVFIEGNPFFYYWFISRIRNIIVFLFPSISDSLIFHLTRQINVLFSAGTLICLWFISKEIFEDEWIQLLPVFFLANLQMFFILSAGINYDNLVTLLCSLSILFILRISKRKAFWKNTYLLAFILGIAALSKKTVLPLVPIIIIIWLILLIKYKPGPIEIKGKRFALFAFAVITIFANVMMYGRNLIVYKKIIPGCYQLVTASQCYDSAFVARERDHGLEKKLSYSEAINQGFPSFTNFFFSHWADAMISRIVGIHGHIVYLNPLSKTITFLLIVLTILCFTQIRRPPVSFWILLGIACIYTLILYTYNYDLQLLYAFKGFGVQGRYIFPVISAFLVVLVYGIQSIQPKLIKYLTIITTVLLISMAGPMQIIYFYKSFFYNWF